MAISSLHLRIHHPASLRATLNDIDGNSFDVTGTGVQTFYVNRVPYDKPSDGIGDWMITKDLAERVERSGSCDPLREATVQTLYLPVETYEFPVLCDVIPGDGDTTFVIGAGYGWTFESSAMPGSMVLALRDDEAVVFSDMIGFPVLQAETRKIIEVFESAYPEADLWPPETPEEQKVYDDIASRVFDAIRKPSPEMQKAMQELRTFAGYIHFNE